MCDGLTVPFDLVHLDERSPEIVTATEGRAPCVIAFVDAVPVIVLGAERLRACEGDVETFERELRAALKERQLSLPA
jgi:hypothetical protein